MSRPELCQGCSVVIFAVKFGVPNALDFEIFGTVCRQYFADTISKFEVEATTVAEFSFEI